MSLTINDPVLARLANVLEQELELLRAGRAPEAASLIEEKMQALQDFEGLIQSGGAEGASFQKRRAIETIIQMAEENSVNLAAIRNGVRSAITRLERLNSSASVGSYGRGGAQLSFTNATGVYNRKA